MTTTKQSNRTAPCLYKGKLFVGHIVGLENFPEKFIILWYKFIIRSLFYQNDEVKCQLIIFCTSDLFCLPQNYKDEKVKYEEENIENEKWRVENDKDEAVENKEEENIEDEREEKVENKEEEENVEN